MNYYELNKFVSLSSLLSDILDQVTGHHRYYALLGEIRSREIGDHFGAIDALSKAIILDPSHTYYSLLGLSYYYIKEYQSALDSFDHALDINTHDVKNKAITLYNKACILSLTGKTTEALEVLSQAILQDSSLSKLAQKDKDFASISETVAFQEIIDSAEIFDAPYNEVCIGKGAISFVGICFDSP